MRKETAVNHTEAAATFKKCRDKNKGYRLALNTLLQKRGNSFVVRLHETDIVTIRPDGTYRLDSGGWKTVTTKARMSDILPRPVYQAMGIWYVNGIPFYDGMLIESDGNPSCPNKLMDIEKVKTMVDKTFSKFLEILCETLINTRLSEWRDATVGGKIVVPRINSKTYSKRLWDMVTTIVDNNMAERSSFRHHVWSGCKREEREKIIAMGKEDRDSRNDLQWGDEVMDGCIFPKCKYLSDFVYIGKDICSEHWAKLCEADGKTEKGLLKKIGLVRNKDGAVVPITLKKD